MRLIIRRPLHQWISGALTILLGVFIVWEGSHYSLGRGFQLGPGAFPIGAGVLLALLGTGIILEKAADGEVAVPRLRPPLFVVAGIVAWAYLIERHGLYPATFALVALSAMGDKTLRPRMMLVVAAVLSVIGHIVFIVGLGLPMEAFSW